MALGNLEFDFGSGKTLSLRALPEADVATLVPNHGIPRGAYVLNEKELRKMSVWCAAAANHLAEARIRGLEAAEVDQ
jgi:hypothetical protein